VSAVKFLNFAYTRQGADLYNFGIEGLTYNRVDGIPRFTDLVLRNTTIDVGAAGYLFRVHFAPKYREPDTNANPVIAGFPEAREWRLKWSDDPDVDHKYRMFPVTISRNEISEFTNIMINVSAYAQEMALKFILGVEPISNFDAYVQQLYAMRFLRAKELQQKEYDALLRQ
jgi:putative aldouronate transport system substrate-binding protein